MIYIFYFLAFILIFLSILSLRGGLRYLNFFKSELAKPESNFAPFVSVVAPCRGLDEDLKGNVRALYSQNYPAYEIIFVVDDASDAAVPLIETAWKSVPTSAVSKLVVAGRATNTGQKVHNLRRAVREVSVESEIFVFVDSDARVGKDWLKNLIAPLEDKQIGATTGYRWFVSKKRNFATDLRSVWNASIASSLGANAEGNFCWGGSMAIRRPIFERLKIAERWRGAVSDDFTVTNAMRENRLPIRFVPQCLIASNEECTFDEMLEFTTRQMKITRVYAPHLWMASLLSGLIFTIVFYGLIVLFLWLLRTGESFWLSLVFLLVIFALGAYKAKLRLDAVKLVLKKYENELNESFRSQILLFPLSPPIYLYNSICAALSRKIVWRGIGYEMKSPKETVVFQPVNEPIDETQTENKTLENKS